MLRPATCRPTRWRSGTTPAAILRRYPTIPSRTGAASVSQLRLGSATCSLYKLRRFALCFSLLCFAAARRNAHRCSLDSHAFAFVCVAFSGRLPGAADQHEPDGQRGSARLRKRRRAGALRCGPHVDRLEPFDDHQTESLLPGRRRLDRQLAGLQVALVLTYARLLSLTSGVTVCLNCA